MGNFTPRRGIPTLIADVRRACKRLGIKPAGLAEASGMGYSTAAKLLGKTPQTNLKVDSETCLRDWLKLPDVCPEPAPTPPDSEPQQRPPATCLDPLEDLKGGQQLDLPLTREVAHGYYSITVQKIIDEVRAILPITKELQDYLAKKVAACILAAMEEQAEESGHAHSALMVGLEEQVASLEASLKMEREASMAKFQLGKDTALMSGGERGALRALLTKTEAENIHLRAAMKSLTQTL